MHFWIHEFFFFTYGNVSVCGRSVGVIKEVVEFSLVKKTLLNCNCWEGSRLQPHLEGKTINKSASMKIFE